MQKSKKLLQKEEAAVIEEKEECEMDDQENEPEDEDSEDEEENNAEGEPPAKKGKTAKKSPEKSEKEEKPLSENDLLKKKILKLGEIIRRTKCPKFTQIEKLEELKAILKGNYAKYVYNHAVSRVIEWMIKLAAEDLTTAITQELKGTLKNMARQKYSKHVVVCLITKADKQTFEAILKELSEDIIKLMLLGTSNSVVTELYKKASKEQKQSLKHSFYGKSFKTFRSKNILNLKDVGTLSQTEKDSIFNEIHDNLSKVIEKSTMKSELIVEILREYLEVMEVGNAKHAALVTVLQSNFVELEQYKEGAWLATHCLWHSSAKERKQIMKLVKAKPSLATSAVGYAILVAMMDCIDDTTLLNKIVLQPLLEDCETLCGNMYGMKVLSFAIKPRSTLFLHPEQIKFLQEGESNPHSKKDPALRQKEIKGFAVPLVASKILDNFSAWIQNAHRFLFIKALVDETDFPEVIKLLELFTSLLTQPDYKETTEHKGTSSEMLLIEVPFAQKLAMHLIKEDKRKYAADSSYKPIFCEMLVSKIKETPEFWLDSNRGILTFLCMLETEIPSVTSKLQKILKPHVLMVQSMTDTSKSAEALLKLLT
ncbi:Hypothetical predicted protein [Cloeon dipterum]|uniref:CPL domain-containing protein n=1 Tax=Cloeon dipterum TaxID=197152 RepID=A0A8S1CWE2_9INSE|nr:Hypothetical predicted protein [Cloeon dipterum]